MSQDWYFAVTAAEEWRAVSSGLTVPWATDDPEPPDPPATSDRFWVSAAELSEYETRSVSGPYKTVGDVSTNSPGDWDRIAVNAGDFRSNPTQGRWVQSGTGVIRLGDPDASSLGRENRVRMVDAGFYAMVTDDTDLKAKLKTELLWQIGEWSYSPLNYGRWAWNYWGFYPAPHFQMSRWVVQLAMVRDYLGRDYFTALENEDLDRYFYGHCNYYVQILTNESEKRFPNRWSEDYSTSASAGSLVGPIFDDGPGVYQIAYHLNNRRECLAASQAMLAAYLKWAGYVAPTTADEPAPTWPERDLSGSSKGQFWTTDELVLHGKMCFNEQMRYHVYPEGGNGDFSRAYEGSGVYWTGWQYASATSAYQVEMADAYARIGDWTLYNLVTSQGAHGTDGTPKLAGYTDGKSLEFHLVAMVRYANRAWPRTVKSTDPVDTGQVNDMQLAVQGNRYYKNSLLEDAYLRSGSGFFAYPSTPKSIGGWGSQAAYRGQLNLQSGVLFRWAGLENLADNPPYS